MSHPSINESINDKLRQLASDIQDGVDNSAITIGIYTAKTGGDCNVTKHTGWIVLQRLQHHDGKSFIAPTFCDTKTEAEMYASAFDNIVAIMPIEWEE